MKKIVSIITIFTMFFTMWNFSFISEAAYADFSSDTVSSTIDETMQYHYGNNYYDVYLWVPKNTSPGNLKSLVAIKANLIEVPFVYSTELRNALAGENSGIMFIVMKRKSNTNPDVDKYNNVLNNFYARNDYAGNPLYTDSSLYPSDGKDASDIMNDMLAGIASASGYTEIANKTPIITIGHSAASPFGYSSGNWNPKRVIAQIEMKNGMGAPVYQSHKGIVPKIPTLQYAAQYTEHALGADRDRSYTDALWQLANARGQTTDTNEYLTSHIIEWGSGHYDWSANATTMLKDYIINAIDARVPSNFDPNSNPLKDLTGTGYIATPFAQGQVDDAYNNKGWLSSGQVEDKNTSTSIKKSGFWYFSKDFEKEVNDFTKYSIPKNPGVTGKTYTTTEPYMLLKDPSNSSTTINPDLSFNSGMSRYGTKTFNNYKNGKYGDLTVDSYYMNTIPTTSTHGYDGEGSTCAYPANQKAEVVPLIAPYQVVSSTLTKDPAADSSNPTVASVTTTTLRYHNNRVYYAAPSFDCYGFIKSPEIGKTPLADGSDGSKNYSVTSQFKATAFQMNVPIVTGYTAQTLTLGYIDEYNINRYSANANDVDIPVNIASTDANLNNLNSDLMIEYGPAKTVRGSDGKWHIQILPDQIPTNAVYPIEVNVVASNLGETNSVNAASVSQKFLIVNQDTPATQVKVNGQIVASGDLDTSLAYLQGNVIDVNAPAILVLNKSCTIGSSKQIKSKVPLTILSSNPYTTATLTRDSSGVDGPMINAESADITIGQADGYPINIVDNKYVNGTSLGDNYCTFAVSASHKLTLNNNVTVNSASYPLSNKALFYLGDNSTLKVSGAKINYTAGPLFAGGNNVTADFDGKSFNIQKLTNLTNVTYKNVPNNYEIINDTDGYYYLNTTYPSNIGLKIGTGKLITEYSTIDDAVTAIKNNYSSKDITIIVNKDSILGANTYIEPKNNVTWTIITNNSSGVRIIRDTSSSAAQMIKAVSGNIVIGGSNSQPITIIDKKYPSGYAKNSNWCTLTASSGKTLTLNNNVTINSNSYGDNTPVKALAYISGGGILKINGAKINYLSDGYLVAGDTNAGNIIDFNNEIPSFKALYASGTYQVKNLPSNYTTQNINGITTVVSNAYRSDEVDLTKVSSGSILCTPENGIYSTVFAQLTLPSNISDGTAYKFYNTTYTYTTNASAADTGATIYFRDLKELKNKIITKLASGNSSTGYATDLVKDSDGNITSATIYAASDSGYKYFYRDKVYVNKTGTFSSSATNMPYYNGSAYGYFKGVDDSAWTELDYVFTWYKYSTMQSVMACPQTYSSMFGSSKTDAALVNYYDNSSFNNLIAVNDGINSITVGNATFTYNPKATDNDEFKYSNIQNLENKVQSYYGNSDNLITGVTFNYIDGIAVVNYASSDVYNNFMTNKKGQMTSDDLVDLFKGYNYSLSTTEGAVKAILQEEYTNGTISGFSNVTNSTTELSSKITGSVTFTANVGNISALIKGDYSQNITTSSAVSILNDSITSADSIDFSGVKISPAGDGSDISSSYKWISESIKKAFEEAYSNVCNALNSAKNDLIVSVDDAIKYVKALINVKSDIETAIADADYGKGTPVITTTMASVKINGDLKIDSKLTAVAYDENKNEILSDKLSYQWYRVNRNNIDAQPIEIEGATDKYYVLTADDKGYRIKVVVSNEENEDKSYVTKSYVKETLVLDTNHSSTGSRGSGGSGGSGGSAASNTAPDTSKANVPSNGNAGGNGTQSNSNSYQWKNIGDGKWMLNNEKGESLVGWQKVDNKWYYTDSKGVMTTGWQMYENKFYHLNPVVGSMDTGWIQEDQKWYHLNPASGAMETGWINDNGKWYYLNPTSGEMLTGWVNDNGKWYYLNTDSNGYKGAMVLNVYIDGYYLGADGAWV